MKQYLNLIEKVMNEGVIKEDRTGKVYLLKIEKIFKKNGLKIKLE